MGGHPLRMSEEKSPIEDSPVAESFVPGPVLTARKFVMTPVGLLACLAIVLLVLLVLMSRRGVTSGSAADSADLAELQAEANALRGQLNRERIELGLRPLDDGSEPIREIAVRLKKDTDTLVTLAGSLEAMLEEKDLKISAMGAELLRSAQSRQGFAAESARLQGELQQAAVNGAEGDRLRRDLAAMKTQRDALAGELAELRKELASKQAAGVPDDLLDLKRRFDETLRAKEFFEAKAKELEGNVSKFQLFARAEGELLPAGVELFRGLRALESRPEAEIADAYGSMGVKLGATLLQTFSFASGAAGLTSADEDAIRYLVRDIPDGDLLLVVGYASETGDAEKNQQVSAERATAVAELYHSIKRPGQLVQAVHLGQADRFSSRFTNRSPLIEIWRIRKK